MLVLKQLRLADDVKTHDCLGYHPPRRSPGGGGGCSGGCKGPATSSQEGHCCLNFATRRVSISRHVIFDEQVFPFTTSSLPWSRSFDFLATSDVATSFVVSTAVTLSFMGVEQSLPSICDPSSADVEQSL